MIVRVLGSAAGGGVPQWNCACPQCTAARAGTIPRRSQSSFAVSGDGERWWLINVSPDIAQQIETVDALRPRGVRGSPIAGMLLTDANVDHLGGLAVLRQNDRRGFTLYSSAVVRDLATAQQAFATFGQPPHVWHTFSEGETHELDARLTASATVIGAGTTPGYDGRRHVRGAVVAITIVDRATGGRLLAAPVFGAVDLELREAVRAADVALLDGSFFTDDEMTAYGEDDKSARRLGHQPVGGAGGSLATLADETARTRCLFVHLNNTNPLTDPRSAAARAAAESGFEVAVDGLAIEL